MNIRKSIIWTVVILTAILTLSACKRKDGTIRDNDISILFIGNSHTYFNDMPLEIKKFAAADGFNCNITVLAHPGFFLDQHYVEPEASLNIRTGQYDYVVLQGHANPFDSLSFYNAVEGFDHLIQDAGSKTVLFEPWVMESASSSQETMHDFYSYTAEKLGALLAPVGMKWKELTKSFGIVKPELYDYDRIHASLMGSQLAARIIWDTIRGDAVR